MPIGTVYQRGVVLLGVALLPWPAPAPEVLPADGFVVVLLAVGADFTCVSEFTPVPALGVDAWFAVVPPAPVELAFWLAVELWLVVPVELTFALVLFGAPVLAVPVFEAPELGAPEPEEPEPDAPVPGAVVVFVFVLAAVPACGFVD